MVTSDEQSRTGEADKSGIPILDVCWQCGASADPVCAYVQPLYARTRQCLDPMGYPMTRGARTDRLRVPVPRCAMCKKRKYVQGFLVFAAAVTTALFLAGRILPDRGFGLAIGWVGGAVFGAVVVLAYERRQGRRTTDSFPPLVRLKRAGWMVPD